MSVRLDGGDFAEVNRVPVSTSCHFAVVVMQANQVGMFGSDLDRLEVSGGIDGTTLCMACHDPVVDFLAMVHRSVPMCVRLYP